MSDHLISGLAAENLQGKDGHLCVTSPNGTVVITTDTVDYKGGGVLINDPKSGHQTSIMDRGEALVRAGGTITGFGYFGCTASGTAVMVNSGDSVFAFGLSLEGVSSGSKFRAEMFPPQLME